MTQPKDGKQEILQAFNQLLQNYQNRDLRIATREEEAEKAKNQELLNRVAEYTVDNIVNSMASLQLDFGNMINSLSERLSNEANKLEQLQKAIQIETENLARLQQVRLVADALYILRQEHQEKLRKLQEVTQQQRETITQEQESIRKIWTREQEEFTKKINEERELLLQTRERQKADLMYARERQRKIETDQYQEFKRQQERELAEIAQNKEKNWREREQYLAANQADFATKQKQAEGFPQELEKAYEEARVEGIKEAERENKVKTDLLEKEWEATKQGYELKIQSLEATVAKQIEQINEILGQLQAANTQAQNLAARALQGQV